MFNGNRLSLARKRRRLTAKRLAELCALAPLTVTRLEKQENVPDEETVDRLARALDYPRSFFFLDDPDDVPANAVSFRSLTKMTAKERDAALSASSLGLQLFDWIEGHFDLPHTNLIDLSTETNAESAARSLRQHWAIGERPIGNIVSLLEANGIRVLSLSENTASVDAFSFWRDDKAYIFLNNFKTAERSRFDAAHELGHLVLHRHAGPKPSRPSEREADSFASAFLMPANDVRARIQRVSSVETVIKAKARWRVSAMAMAYRLHSVGRLSDWQYKSICIELGRRGFRSSEPGGIEREVSVLMRNVLASLWGDRVSKNDIADALSIPLDEMEGLIWGLAGESQQPTRGASLKLVR